MICWSDECSVEQGRGKRSEWVFRTSAQKWDKEMVQTYGTNKNMKIMVWGAFWDVGRSGCYIMDRDFESKKYGYCDGATAHHMTHRPIQAFRPNPEHPKRRLIVVSRISGT